MSAPGNLRFPKTLLRRPAKSGHAEGSAGVPLRNDTPNMISLAKFYHFARLQPSLELTGIAQLAEIDGWHIHSVTQNVPHRELLIRRAISQSKDSISELGPLKTPWGTLAAQYMTEPGLTACLTPAMTISPAPSTKISNSSSGCWWTSWGLFPALMRQVPVARSFN